MNKQNEILENKLKLKIDEHKIKLLEDYSSLFLEKNKIVNLISKNDENFLFEKHIFDSLALNLFFKKMNAEAKGALLDIGTGGGFPALPLAIVFPDLNIYAVDSIRKKINAIEDIKTTLNLKNIYPTCARVENITEKFDFITSRAVASLDLILKYAIPKLKKGGYFIAYKSKKATEEIKEAKKTISFSKLELIDILEYTLPIENQHERNLIIFKQTK